MRQGSTHRVTKLWDNCQRLELVWLEHSIILVWSYCDPIYGIIVVLF